MQAAEVLEILQIIASIAQALQMCPSLSYFPNACKRMHHAFISADQSQPCKCWMKHAPLSDCMSLLYDFGTGLM